MGSSAVGDKGGKMNLQLGEKVKPPAGYLKMLVKHPVYAMRDWRLHQRIGEIRNVAHPHDVAQIFKSTGKDFTYKTESMDKWHLQTKKGKFTGDCEESALANRHKAKNLGLSSRLLLCAERKPNAKGHCVLLIDYWVLDCNMPEPVSLEKFNDMYKLGAISSPALLGSWHKVIIGE